MLTRAKAVAASLFMGTAIVLTPVSPAAAQVQDGLVNVNVGDVTILEDVNVAVAANVVAQICGLQVQNVTLLAQEVDVTGTQQTVCRTPGRGRGGQDVTITQN